MLTSPYQEDTTYVLVASRGGDDRHPAWFLNLQSDPNVMVKTGRSTPPQPMSAEVATSEERARIWPTIAKKYPHYGGYQEKTDREIPLVLLRPIGG